MTRFIIRVRQFITILLPDCLLFADDEELDKDLDDLIDDNPVEQDAEEGDSGEEGGQTGGEKRQHSDYEEDLEDEDYDLLEENLGIRVKRKVGH